MKQHRRFDLFQCFVLLLVCMLCAGNCAPAQAAGDVNTLKDALSKADSLDGQLALLYDASVAYGDLFETGGWKIELNAPAAGGQEWVPTEEAYDGAEKSNSLPELFRGKRLIALYHDERAVCLAGDLYVRLPEALRARNTQEAEGVLILRHYLTARSDYVGSAYNRHYALYARLFDSDVLYCLYHKHTTPPLMGRGTLTGETLAASLLWEGMRPLFYDQILTVDTAEGPLSFRVTGRNCSLYQVEGDREVLDVPAEVEGHPVTDLSFSNLGKACPSLREARLPEGLVSIGTYAFRYCEKLRTVNFPSTLRTISDSAFGGMPGLPPLEAIVLNEGLETIGAFAFLGTDDLRSVTLPSTVKVYSRGFLEYGGSFPYLVVPEGAERLEDYFLSSAKRTLCVYLPQTVTSFGLNLLADGRIRIYTPEGSPAAKWAEKKGYGYTPCSNPENMPKPAFVTEGDFEYAVLEGEAILIRYLGKGGKVVVPDQLGGCPVKRVKTYAFYKHEDIQSVTFPAGLVELEAWAVYECKGVRVYIPGADTALSHSQSIFSDGAAVYAPAGSLAQQWCQKNKLEWVEWTPGR